MNENFPKGIHISGFRIKVLDTHALEARALEFGDSKTVHVVNSIGKWIKNIEAINVVK